MTRLRLFDTDGAAAEDVASHLFATPARHPRYKTGGWACLTSVVLHATTVISAVMLGHYLAPTQRPTPAPQQHTVAHAFVFTRTGKGHSKHAAVAVAGDVARAPVPPPAAAEDSRAPDASPIVDEQPPRTVNEKPVQAAFDPPLPAGDARLTGRRGDPSEAGFGSATASLPGLVTGEIKPGGLGEGDVRNVRSGPPTSRARPGIDDGGEGDGATPPQIQQPLPIPDYPAAARTHRLQGVVVLEVMLDALGKAHVRGVLSDPLGFGIEEAASNAAEKLKFTPARHDGRFVDAIVQVRVTFTLNGSATTVTGGA